MATPTSPAELDASWLSKPVTVPVALILFLVGGGATFLGVPAAMRGESISREEVKELIGASDKLNEQRYDEILRRLDRMEQTCNPAPR